MTYKAELAHFLTIIYDQKLSKVIVYPYHNISIPIQCFSPMLLRLHLICDLLLVDLRCDLLSDMTKHVTRLAMNYKSV